MKNSSLKENKKRLIEIKDVLLKHELVKGITPEKLRLIIEDLGPTFIKLGQIMSMRSDILTEEYCNELKSLREKVKPMDMNEVRKIIESQYNLSISELCLEFEEKPLGSASIAQAHYAVLKDGSRVVFKIQRPDIEETMSRDIFLLRKASGMIKIAINSGNTIDFNLILDEMWAVAKQEMNFLIEAKNAEEFYKLNEDIVYSTCPKIYNEYTTSKILVMEYIDGVQIGNVDVLTELGYDLRDIGEKLCENYIKQIVDDAFFHADPHPGNLRIRDGEIVWIDLGMVGRLSNRDRNLIKEGVKAIAAKDINELKDVALALSNHDSKINHSMLYDDLDNFLMKYANEDMAKMDLAKVMEDFLELAKKNGLSMKDGITILGRGLITIQGVVAVLSPELNVIDVIVNHISGDMIKEFDFNKELRQDAYEIYLSGKKMIELPRQISEILKVTKKGQLKVNVEFIGSEGPIEEFNKMVNKLVMGIIILGLLIGSSLISNINIEPKIFNIPFIGAIGFIFAGILSVILIYNIISKK